MNRLRIANSVMFAVLAGCAATSPGLVRIDGSSASACKASWKRMEASLNGQQRQRLDIALLLIGSEKQHKEGTLATSVGISPASIREEIDGKDFTEILALAKATGTTITDLQRGSSR